MNTKFVAYHEKTNDIALLNSDGKYWIGAYSSRLTHQNGEPLYYFLENVDNESAGLQRLKEMTGDEF